MDANNRRLLRRIRHRSSRGLPPTFVGMEFVRYVRDPQIRPRHEAPWAWAVYLSHDPCHDPSAGRRADRWTVIAFHRLYGDFRIIGRELDRRLALEIAKGEW
jgi:hypothetical protein